MKFIIILLCLTFSVNLKSQIMCNRVQDSITLLANLKKGLSGFNFKELLPNCNVSESIKNWITEKVANPPYTYTQIDSIITKNALNTYPLYYNAEIYNSLAKGNDSLYFVILDSIKQVEKMKHYNFYKKLENNYMFGVSRNLILSSGWLYLEKTKPILYKALEDKNYKYERKFVELSLARLGDKKSIEIVKNNITKYIHSQNDSREWQDDYRKNAPYMIFPAQQETIYEMHNWLDTTLYSTRTLSSASKERYFFYSYKVLSDLSHIIKNKDFQKMIESYDFYEETFTLNDKYIIQQCKEWLIKNKGKYVINPYHCPYL